MADFWLSTLPARLAVFWEDFSFFAIRISP
nr:MAG TPA: hypothetical protein [Caudoviricetes sp.]